MNHDEFLRPFKPVELSTAQRDLLTKANGLVIYNTDIKRIEFCLNNYWVAPIFETWGKWDFSQTIQPGATYLHQIPLGANDYTLARIYGYIPNSIGGNAGRQHFDIVGTTAKNDAYSRATSVSFLNVYGYPTPDWKIQGYYYKNDNKLAEDGVFQNTTAGNNRIESFQINGENLETAYKDLNGIVPSILTMEGQYAAKK